MNNQDIFSDETEYSIEALESKALFYDKNLSVYVEGKDDVLFWNYLFKLANVNAHIEEVGGKDEVEKYVHKIIYEGADFVVAMDNDHSDFLDSIISHQNIIRSYGYSIENSMYNSINLELAIIKYSKLILNIQEYINNWMEEFSNKLKDLIIYDVANIKYNKGVQVFGDNCQRFLTNNTSIEVDSNKVENFIKRIESSFEESEVLVAKELVEGSNKKLWFHIKGHFLSNAILNLIKHYTKSLGIDKINISHDSIFSHTIDCTICAKHNIDINFVLDNIKELKAA